MAEIERNPIEILADEFVDRYRAGEQPSLTEYTEQHPELAEEIRDLFPTIVAMEQFKRNKLQSGSGRASLNGEQITNLGDFRIIREIGRGGMGVVYEAEQQSLGRHVAVKVLPQQARLDNKQMLRFQREAQTAARLHHTNIVPVFGVGQQEGFHYYAMQYIRGVGLDVILNELKRREGYDPSESDSSQIRPPLSASAAVQAMLDGTFSLPRKLGSPSDASATLPGVQLLAEPEEDTAIPPLSMETEAHNAADLMGGSHEDGAEPPSEPLSKPSSDAAPPARVGDRVIRSKAYWRTIARLGVQVADALQYAHSQGALHRDIKPANLLLDAHGAVWVTDFGLAKALDDESVTRTGDIVGTLRYMAPEQFDGDGDARSDTYSLGLTLYELLTLQPAFTGINRARLVQTVMAGDPPRPRSVCPEIPRDLETIVLKAIAREPQARYQSSGELCEDLERFLEDRTILARRPNPVERLVRWCRRNRAVAALTLTAFMAALTAAIVGWVGYVQTTGALAQVSEKHTQALQATERAEGNLSLSMLAFEEIFEKLAGRDKFELIEDSEERGDPEQWEDPDTPDIVTAREAALLQSMLDFYDKFADRNSGDQRLQQETARANRRVGDIQWRMGNLEDAERAYRKALIAYRRLALGEATGTYAREQATVLNDLGRVLWRTGRSREAEVAHRQALAELTKLQDRSPADQLELARTFNHISLGKRNTERREVQTQAIEILARLLAQSPTNAQYRMALARSKLMASRGYFSGFFGQGSSSGPRRTGSRPPRERTGSERTGSGRNGPTRSGRGPGTGNGGRENPTRGGSGGRSPRGWRPPSNEQREYEQKQAVEAVAMLRELASDFPQNGDYQIELAEALSQTSLLWYRKDPAVVLQHLEEAVEISQKLVDRQPTRPDYRFALANQLKRLAMSQLMSGANVQGMEVYRRSGEQLAELIHRHPDVPTYLKSHSWTYTILGESYRRNQEFVEAQGAFQEALHSTDAYLALKPDARTLELKITQLDHLAQTLEALGEDDAAAETARQADTIRVEARVNPRSLPTFLFPGRGPGGRRPPIVQDTSAPNADDSAEQDAVEPAEEAAGEPDEAAGTSDE